MGNLYILLVEDDKNVAETMRLVLDNQGYRVRVARDLDEAFRVFNEEKPSVILLDYILPDGEPSKFVDYVRAHAIETPIILVTAASHAEALAQSLRIKDVLKKPFTLDDLFHKIGDCINCAASGSATG